MNKRPWFFQPWARVVIGLLLLIVLGGAVSAVVISQTVPEQPIQFPHSTHVGFGLECRYCHPGVDWGPTAGLPTTDKCWGCHQQVNLVRTDSEELMKLAEYAENGEQIPWVPVFHQPDFVQFNHKGHVQSGLACETCHGDLSQQTVAEAIPLQNMGWCLDCHRDSAAEDTEEWERLSDCSLCHY